MTDPSVAIVESRRTVEGTDSIEIPSEQRPEHTDIGTTDAERAGDVLEAMRVALGSSDTSSSTSSIR